MAFKFLSAGYLFPNETSPFLQIWVQITTQNETIVHARMDIKKKPDTAANLLTKAEVLKPRGSQFPKKRDIKNS